MKIILEENKIAGYILSAIDVVVAGAMIVVNGLNTISREATRNLLGDRQTEYFLTARWRSQNFWASAGSKGWESIRLSCSLMKFTACIARG